MKRILLLIMLLVATQAQAKPQPFLTNMRLDPYIGVEYQYENISGSDDWRYFMPASFQNGAVFIGNKFNEVFALEVGYYHYLKTSQGTGVGSEFDGQTASGPTGLIAAMRLKGFTIDWTVHHFLDPKFNVFALMGLVTSHTHLVIRSDNATDLGNGMSLVKPENQTYLRFGGGMEYLEQCWGARLRVLWDNTRRMTINNSNAQTQFASIGPDPFRNAIVITVGVFYRF